MNGSPEAAESQVERVARSILLHMKHRDWGIGSREESALWVAFALFEEGFLRSGALTDVRSEGWLAGVKAGLERAARETEFIDSSFVCAHAIRAIDPASVEVPK